MPPAFFQVDKEPIAGSNGCRLFDHVCVDQHQTTEENAAQVLAICKLDVCPLSTPMTSNDTSNSPNETMPLETPMALHASLQPDWKRVMLQAPECCELALDDSFDVVWDSGASMCISNNKNDFVGKIEPLTDLQVDGISSQLELEGMGNVCWTLIDVSGNPRNLVLPAHHAPKARQ